jgi:hypothetical protein
MGKAIRASALIFLLACSAHAGWMGNGSPAPPPEPVPTPTSVTQASTTTDEDTTGATDTLTQIVLAVLASVLP